MNNDNADIRKCAVFVLVEVFTAVGHQQFEKISQELGPSQQRLVEIYLKRRE
jgi:hypothetical protein